MNQHGAIGLHHQHPNGLGQVRRESTGIVHRATGDNDAHDQAGYSGARPLATRTTLSTLAITAVAS